jgi:hypothetical protein
MRIIVAALRSLLRLNSGLWFSATLNWSDFEQKAYPFIQCRSMKVVSTRPSMKAEWLKISL